MSHGGDRREHDDGQAAAASDYEGQRTVLTSFKPESVQEVVGAGAAGGVSPGDAGLRTCHSFGNRTRGSWVKSVSRQRGASHVVVVSISHEKEKTSVG